MNFSMIKKKLLQPTILIINIHGVIMAAMTQHVESSLKQVNTTTAKALAISINSSGDYPHQHHLPLLTFAQDIAASGGYLILCAGDKVYADRTSIVGSIGVIYQRFNLKGLAEWAQIEPRSITTDQKLLLNFSRAFRDPSPKNTQAIEAASKRAHKQFIDYVEKQRGSKLKVLKDQRAEAIFDAKVFEGEEAVKLGLVDELGNITQVLASNYPECKLNLVSQRWSMRKRMEAIKTWIS